MTIAGDLEWQFKRKYDMMELIKIDKIKVLKEVIKFGLL